MIDGNIWGIHKQKKVFIVQIYWQTKVTQGNYLHSQQTTLKPIFHKH